MAVLERVTPHLARAVKLQVQRFLFSTDALVGHAFVNRWLQPVILTTTDGELLRLNNAAQRLLQSTSMVRTSGSKVILPAPYLQRFLDDCARTEARVRADPNAHADASRYRVMRIDDDGSPIPQHTLYAFYNLIVPGEVSAMFGMRAIAMLIFYHPSSSPPVDEDLLAAAFDLTPAECRVAHFMAEGMSPKEIAVRVGVQHDTVRKQLQSIYQKTSTNRQPDLIRLLLHLPGVGGGV
jgi:DNA-binding CsgD family transcriptional regulator